MPLQTHRLDLTRDSFRRVMPCGDVVLTSLARLVAWLQSRCAGVGRGRLYMKTDESHEMQVARKHNSIVDELARFMRTKEHWPNDQRTPWISMCKKCFEQTKA